MIDIWVESARSTRGIERLIVSSVTICYKILDEIRCVHRFFLLNHPRTTSWKEVSDSKINFYDNDIILFHSEIEKNWGWDRTKFKLNRWKKIGSKSIVSPIFLVLEKCEKGGKRWSKNKMKKEERERREAASQADNRMKICMSRKICVSLSWFSSGPFFFFFFFFFSRPNDAETGQKLKPLVRAKTDRTEPFTRERRFDIRDTKEIRGKEERIRVSCH